MEKILLSGDKNMDLFTIESQMKEINKNLEHICKLLEERNKI